MQQIYRYHLKPGAAEAFREWLVKKDQTFKDGAPEGQQYLGTWFTVQGFGEYAVESRWEVDDYAALGAGPGSEEFQALLSEWFGFADNSRRQKTTLLKRADEVRILEGL